MRKRKHMRLYRNMRLRQARKVIGDHWDTLVEASALKPGDRVAMPSLDLLGVMEGTIIKTTPSWAQRNPFARVKGNARYICDFDMVVDFGAIPEFHWLVSYFSESVYPADSPVVERWKREGFGINHEKKNASGG